MARLAKSTWGVEAGAIRSSNLALSVSLRANGIMTAGSGTHTKEIGKLAPRVTNVVARRIKEESKTARLPASHAAAGVLSVVNAYNAKCALFLDRVLRTTKSSIRKKMPARATQVFATKRWKPRVV